MSLSTTNLKVISASIFRHFRDLDNPPADEIYVPLAAIREDKKEANTLTATVRFVTTYIQKKEHTIRIKFQVDPNGRFLSKTWSYV